MKIFGIISRRFALDDAGIEVLCDALAKLNERAAGWFEREKAPEDAQMLQLVVDARYVGQNFELAVPIAAGPTLSSKDVGTAKELHTVFCNFHETAYGYASPDDAVEIVNVRLSASARFYKESVAIAVKPSSKAPQPTSHRAVFFDAGQSVETAIYPRADLQPGQIIDGPAIIEQLDTTTPVYPGDVATVAANHHLIISIGQGATS